MYLLLNLIMLVMATSATPVGYQLIYVTPADYPYPDAIPKATIFAPIPPLVRHAVLPFRRFTHDQLLQPSPVIANSIAYNFVPVPDKPSKDTVEVAQFHSQDATGRVVFGFNSPNQARMESRSADGTVRGSYSYIDPYGRTVRMQYWDDGTGFHTSSNEIPMPESVSLPEPEPIKNSDFPLFQPVHSPSLPAGEDVDDEGSHDGSEHDSSEGCCEPDYVTTGDHVYDTFAFGGDDSGSDHSDSESVIVDSPDYINFDVGPVKKPVTKSAAVRGKTSAVGGGGTSKLKKASESDSDFSHEAYAVHDVQVPKKELKRLTPPASSARTAPKKDVSDKS